MTDRTSPDLPDAQMQEHDLPEDSDAEAVPAPVRLAIGLVPAINAALYANNVPVLTELTLVNATDEALGDVSLELTCDVAAMRPKTWRLAQVGAGQVRAVADLDIGLDGSWLAALTESVRGVVSLTVRAGDRVLAEQQRDVRFLAHNEWGGNGAIPDLLAAFVEPNDPAVPGILRKASDLLREAGKPDGLEGYQTRTKARVWEQAAAIWSAVCALDPRYANPPPSFEQTGQRIRPPRQITEDRLATCLDLTVLFAACLEHVGLCPLIVLKRGHAFPGVWLSAHDFGVSVADDAAGLRTRIALDDLLLFEATLCCQSPAPAFTRACAVGKEQVSAAQDAVFEGVIDVRRARQRHIRPLGAPVGDRVGPPVDGQAPQPASAPPGIENAPALRDDADVAETEPPPTTPEGRLARWRKRLLDLSTRNRLLNLSTTGRQAVPIDCPDPVALEARLARMRGEPNPRGLTPRAWPDLMTGADPRSAAIHAGRGDEDAAATFLREAFARDEVLLPRAEEEARSLLTDLYRTARAALQEGGSNVLFLTIGALLWKAKDKDKPYRAPLILVPVILHRESVRSGFQVRMHDDEPHLNTTLLEMLRQDFDVRLPELERAAAAEEGAGVDVAAIFESFRLKARDIPGWEVTEEVALTTLNFTKYLMWRDLADRADALRQNDVARRLLDGPSPDGTWAERSPSVGHGVSDDRSGLHGGALDDHPALLNLVCPMEADSSQLRAVAAAARGESFVLIGPPGTGKSQTITNIIANTLAQRRTVLFVAEKRAALEVVHRRLASKEVGLGDFCLDLFSAKASKMAVLEQLDRAQQAREGADEAEWARGGEDLAALRAELNSYVRELHRRGRSGWTAYRAIGAVLRAEAAGVPEIRLNWPAAEQHDARDYQTLIEATKDAAETMQRLGDIEAYAGLAGIERTDWSPGWQNSLVEAARGATAALADLRAAVAPAFDALALPATMPLPQPTLAALDTLAGLLADPLAPDAAWAVGDAEEACEALYAASALATERATLAARLQGDWQPAAMNLPLARLLADWRAAGDRWLLPRRAGRNAVLAQLASVATRLPPDVSADLETLAALQAKDAELAPLADVIAPVLGRHWRGTRTDFARMQRAITLASRLRAVIAACAPDAPALLAARDHVRRLLADGPDLLGEAGAVGRPLARLRAAWAAVEAALGVLTPLLGLGAGAVVAEETADWSGALLARLHGWADSAAQLRSWCAWQGIRQSGEALGLAPILDALGSGTVGHADAVRVFEANYARWWLNLAVEDLPRIRSFAAARHENRIERFRLLDTKVRDLSAWIVRTRLALAVPPASARQTSPEYALLTRELAKRQRHLPVRQLFARMPRAIRALGPCVMMSPLSVAQHLPADATAFDLVIFDEASQITTWDAIGAIGRGKQVIVVGDPRQLPPTQFFQRQTSDDDVGAEGIVETEDLESVLDECRGAGIPRIELSWHYRSRHESLIAFSNRRYYGGGLVTFPSPVVRDTAVAFRHVPAGVYARGAARTNEVEARAVVAEVVAELRRAIETGRERSIGIVTFNTQQQSLIETLLERERGIDPSLERFFSDESEEPVLVKNLEGVQGEERDIVLFSLTYGPDISGRLAMNFGPLNQQGGERRLNVAVTRAREALLVFGSFRPEQIDLGRTSASGIADLKMFLAFAEQGARAFATAAAGSVGDFESHFEAVVAARLQARGWQVRPQIGVSDFRIDLGVVDPGAAGAFLAGVECDGATYHRSASARDRDRLRQSVLEGLGWRILRVWSTDWWTNAAAETERLHQALVGLRDAAQAARAAPAAEPVPDAGVVLCAPAGDGAPPRRSERPAPEPVVAASPAGSHHYADLAGSAPGVPLDGIDAARFYEGDYQPRLTGLIAAILRAEGPMRDEPLCQRVARLHGFQRTGRIIREAVIAALPAACATTREDDAVFVWPPGVEPSSWSVVRTRAPDSQTDPADIPIEELTILARRALAACGDDTEVALLSIRDACGLARLREAARARCLRAIERAGGGARGL